MTQNVCPPNSMAEGPVQQASNRTNLLHGEIYTERDGHKDPLFNSCNTTRFRVLGGGGRVILILIPSHQSAEKRILTANSSRDRVAFKTASRKIEGLNARSLKGVDGERRT